MLDGATLDAAFPRPTPLATPLARAARGGFARAGATLDAEALAGAALAGTAPAAARGDRGASALRP